MTNEIITLAIRLIIAVCGILITNIIIPWVKSKIGTERLENLLAYVDLAVKAAEQTFGANMGPEKKTAAKEYIIKKAAYLGVILTGDDVDKMIEAAVLEMKYLGKEMSENPVSIGFTTEGGDDTRD